MNKYFKNIIGCMTILRIVIFVLLFTMIRVHGTVMMASDDGEVTPEVPDLKQIELKYALTSDEELDPDELSIDGILSDGDSATRTASSAGDSSDDTSLNQPAGASVVVGVSAR